MMASGLNTWHILIIWYICNFLRQTNRKIFFLATAQPNSRQNGYFNYFRGSIQIINRKIQRFWNISLGNSLLLLFMPFFVRKVIRFARSWSQIIYLAQWRGGSTFNLTKQLGNSNDVLPQW